MPPGFDQRSKELLYRMGEILFKQQQLQFEIMDLTYAFQPTFENSEPFTSETTEEQEQIYQHFCVVLDQLENFMRSNSVMSNDDNNDDNDPQRGRTNDDDYNDGNLYIEGWDPPRESSDRTDG